MGFFDSAKAAMMGNKAYHMHVDANKLAGEGKPKEAGEKYREALRLYDEADRLGGLAPNVNQAHALLLLREGRFDDAKALMQRMAKDKAMSKDDWFQLRIQYSICHWCAGELDEAMETMGRAAQYKMNGAVYSTMGMYWVDKARQTGAFDEALRFNLEALDYDDEDGATLDNLGQLYEAMAEADSERAGEYRAEALKYYEKAHAVKPRQITTLYYLARMYHRSGDDERARKLLSVRDTLYFSHLCPVTAEMMDELAREIG